MPDRITPEQRSAVMRAVRRSGTGAEAVFEALRLRWRFRAQARDLPGTPDFVHDRLKVAIFIDGDFWHGRLWFENGAAPVANRAYWVAKFIGNRARDLAATRRLRRMGWSVIRVWESDLRRCPKAVRRRILDTLCARRGASRAGQPKR